VCRSRVMAFAGVVLGVLMKGLDVPDWFFFQLRFR